MIESLVASVQSSPAVAAENISGGASLSGAAGSQPSVGDLSAFAQSLSGAEKASAVAPPMESARAAFKPLDYINNEASEIATYAKDAFASGNELSPSEIVMLTAKSQEFMFHCQLTSNVANRTSEGLQQLFRQQS